MAHIHEKIDYTADVFIVHRDKVLLRVHDKYGIWLMPGGHIELDENPDVAGIREVKEEVGLDVTLVPALGQIGIEGELDCAEIIPPRFMNRHRINEKHDHISFVYFAKSETDNVIAGGEDRSDQWKWFTREELDDPQYALLKRIRHYALCALDELATK